MYKYFILLYSVIMLSICSEEEIIIDGKDSIINGQNLIKISGDTYNDYKENIIDQYIEFYIKNATHKTEITEDNVKMYVCDTNFITAYLAGIKQDGTIYSKNPINTKKKPKKPFATKTKDLNKEINISSNTVIILVMLYSETNYSKAPTKKTSTRINEILYNKKRLYDNMELYGPFQPSKVFIISEEAIIEQIIIDDNLHYLPTYFYKSFASEWKNTYNIVTEEIRKHYKTSEKIINFLQNNNAPFLNKAIIVKKYGKVFHLGHIYESFINAWTGQRKDLLQDDVSDLVLGMTYYSRQHIENDIIQIDACYLNQISRTLQFYYDFLTQVKNVKNNEIINDLLTLKTYTENEFFLNYAYNTYYQSVIFYDKNILYREISNYIKEAGLDYEESRINNFINIITLKDSGKITMVRQNMILSKLKKKDIKDNTDRGTQQIIINTAIDNIINTALRKLSSKISGYNTINRTYSELLNIKSGINNKGNFEFSNLTNTLQGGILNSQFLHVWLLISLFNIDFVKILNFVGVFQLKKISDDIFTQHIYDHIYSLDENLNNSKTINNDTSMFKTNCKKDCDFTLEFIKNLLIGTLPIKYINQSGNIIEMIIKIRNNSNEYIYPISGAIQKRYNYTTNKIETFDMPDNEYAKVILEKSLLGYYIKTAYPINSIKYNASKAYIKCSDDDINFLKVYMNTLIVNNTEEDHKFMSILAKIDENTIFTDIHSTFSDVTMLQFQLTSSN